ncbi:hypothetical protein SAMD00019534_120250 [Acytostelium subglobosum LB1]|uniref:hypothetical protein n=1 Tax=Acytostelium subglobosum LB1 TaxID=1410327 RepID=UPI0006449CD7|nr:hypothetical protein SAMD00019534_120250 [Acytostelium subglobosum LB1]GAM28849.1 hypothetical protein SAMD00019534_120250 [Acytostelium subglobosum LB1]|eukprot:XP_012748221.1 hypothetical protein SAMD00019534_120250 [Acytostelium subglobosum LB1]
MSMTMLLEKLSANALTMIDGELNCPLCEYMVKRIETMLASKANETVIINTLDNDCKVLVSETFIESCITIVNDYTPLIIHALENKEDPRHICSSIGACNSTMMSVGLLRQFTILGGELDCPLCKYMVKRIDTLLNSKANETVIIDTLDRDCKVLVSETFVESCVTIVNDYTPLIINLLLQKEDPSAICEKISACTSSDNIMKPAIKKFGQYIANLV